MKTDKFTRYGWLTASAVGVLLAQGAIAAGGEYDKQKQQQTQAEQSGQHQQMQTGGQQAAQIPEFDKIDQDGDGQAQWQDIESELDQQLQQANMDQQKVMEQFDQNNDQALDQQEYGSFQTALQEQTGAGQQTAQVPQFDQIDQDGDGQAQWQDIESELDQQLQQANMDQQQVMEQFDQNNDQALDQQEYQSFQTALQQQTGAGQQMAQIPDFEQVDRDGDGEALWEDIETELGQQLQQANLDQEQVMSQFDQDANQSFDQEEYDSLQTALQAQTQMAAAQPGQQQDQQQLDQQQAQQDQQQGQQQAQQDQQQAQQDQQQAQQDQQQAQQDQQQQAQQGQQAPQQAQDIDTTLLSMPVDQVTQAEVVNSRGEQIGRVSRIVRDQDTGELALVVESGGILGLGASSALVSLDEVSQMGENQLLWDTMLSQEEIADIPGFDENEYTEISENEYATLEEATRG